MPAPRLSQSAEAARAAAQQAEFNEKKWVWVPDDKEGYLAGWVHKEYDGDTGEIVMATGGEIRHVPLYALSKMNPPKFDRVEDIADLTFLNEASVVHNLRLRYGSGSIYTYSGLFLVAINPYQNLPLYTDAIVQQYRSKRRDENPPHIFAVAERAWVNMGDERENQSILITGESGAGKTESTKKVIQYLAAIATDAHAPTPSSHSRSPTLGSSGSITSMPSVGLPRNNSFRRGHVHTQSLGSALTSKGRLGLLERQILQANPILEAFGNAQTQRNNNSSRFGKFVRIMFAPDGSIAGANIDWYLLEKSRVVVRNEAERSFHVFYQLLTGGGALKDKLLLHGGVEDYEYLNKSRREIDGVDDLHEWNALKSALDVVGFTNVEQFDLFRIVAAILHIGNIEVTSTRDGDAVMPDPSQAERVCHLLGVPVAEFTKAVLRPRMLAGREWVTQARTGQQASDELAALCKTLYEKSFGCLVDRINEALDRPSSKSTFIGVLDIAGFEIFEINTYEQLLINYTNERLQQFFNNHMFVLEQEEYAREGIEWNYVNFGLDLQPTIDLIEASSGSTIGILSCLDEECIMPKATDLTFTHKLNGLWPSMGAPEDKYVPARFEQGFIIRHYAADVEYRTDGWLEKNKDPLNDNVTRLLASSSERYVAALFADYAEVNGPGGPGNMFTIGRKRVKKGAFRTVAQRHKEQLASLMTQLKATQPHFVRCIVPNGMKKPGRVDVPLVLDQLRCNGVLEGLRIARLGYPNRLPFVDFRQRYEVMTPGIIPRGYMDGREACRRMVKALDLDEARFKLGTSKIFFQVGVLAELEERRDALLYDIFSRLQAAARKWTARRHIKKILHRSIAIRIVQRNARVYNELRDWPWWQLYTKVRPLLAATRSDDQLRRREAELALAKERAERDKQEREALQTLKMALEAEKRKVVDELEAERALAIDKDALLERSKHREAALQEEVAELQVEVASLDSQLTRAMNLQKDTEQKRLELRDMFDQAAEHLVRLESEQKESTAQEQDLVDQLNQANAEIEQLRSQLDELQQVSEDLKNLALQREEDLGRTKDRTDVLIKELEGKLKLELRNKDLTKDKVTILENEVRHAKEQASELTRTATEYSTMIQKKEDRVALLLRDLDALKADREASQKEILGLQSDIDTLAAELDAEKSDRARDNEGQRRLRVELDELRALMEAKSSEETRRNEVERRKEEELSGLRQRVQSLQQELANTRNSSLEAQNKLKVDLEQATLDLNALRGNQQALADRERDSQSELAKVQADLSEREKLRRSLESELQSLRSRMLDTETQLADAQRTKETLERQLASSQAKFHDMEDMMLQLDRDKAAHDRQLDATKKSLDEESSRRSKVEQAYSSQKRELAKLKDHTIKLDRELNQALTDLKNREWEIKQLESRQDKTIVEHIHVLEEAKRLTDRQLAEAKAELEQQTAYIRSLEKAKTGLTREAEDLARETERERVALRAREKTYMAQEEKAAKALEDADKQRKAKEEAELLVRRLEIKLRDAVRHGEELEQELIVVQRSKDNLETELDRLAVETVGPNSMAKVQREYESRISQLEEQLQEREWARTLATRLKERVDRQHAEIRQLVMSSGPSDSTFQSRLLQELQLMHEDLDRELPSQLHSTNGTSGDLQGMANLTPSKRAMASRTSKGSTDVSKASEKQVAALKQHVQVLEIQIAASERVRQHLEAAVRDMSAELDNSDGSKESLRQYRARLAKENQRLAQLLAEEADARRAAETAQVGGIQAMWTKFQNTIAEERQNYSRLEESRKALLIQQKSAQAEVDNQRSQLRELTQAKKTLQAETNNLQQRLQMAQSEASAAKRELQKRLQEEELSASASTAATAELGAVVESYQAKEQSYQQRLEAAEIARAKAARSEAFVKRQLSEMEKAHADSMADRKGGDERLKSAQKKLHELEQKLQEESHENSELAKLNQRLAEELEDEKNQHTKDLEDSAFASEQTQKKYQVELGALTDELQGQRNMLSRLREDNRKLRSEYEQLQLQYNDEVYNLNSSNWVKDRERMETKIADITKAFEASSAAQAEQQSQIVSLHAQVRELRGVLDETEADRALLQKARRALQAELEGIKLDQVDTSRFSSESEFQKLQLKKRDLERALEEHQDRVASATERLQKAEVYANECQMELGKVRVDNSELDRLNANLEKQIKELKLKIVDLETKSYANSPRATLGRRPDSRIDEITSKLQQGEASRLRSTDKIARDAKFQQAESERQRAKMEEERKAYQAEISQLRQAMSDIQSEDAHLQQAKRRVEREAADLKAHNLSLERELERLKSRLERPSSRATFASPTSSPRKQ